MDEENGRLLLQLICDAEALAYLVHVKNLLDEADPSRVAIGQYPRLFRNLPGLRFQGRIHEQIINSLKKIGGPIKETSLTILHLGYAKAQEMAKKYQRNLKLLQKQIMEEPNNAFAHYCLASLYDMMGETDKAIECCQKSIELDHSFPKTHFLLANKLIDKGLFEQARKALEVARSLAPEVPEIHYNLAVISIKQKDYPAAVNHFLDLIQIKPDYPHVRRKLAACYLKLGQQNPVNPV
ncbi:MAG: tetratricopeptide repeat protein [candidate division KSB1 bacterium]|nr:tetratricopeptide repeat protein [candidate division KSB1 bacterium]